MGSAGVHAQPGSLAEVELVPVDDEAEPSGQDLHHGGARCGVLGELLAGVEAEHRDVQPVAAMHDLRDHRTLLNGHLACGPADQTVCHRTIMPHNAHRKDDLTGGTFSPTSNAGDWVPLELGRTDALPVTE